MINRFAVGKVMLLKPANDMLLGPPDPPKIMNKDTELTGRNVTVTWRTLDNNCEIIMYTLYHRIVGPALKEENWSSVTTNDTKYTLQLQYSKEYEIIVSAWNKLGGSNSTEWHLRTAQGKNIQYDTTLFHYASHTQQKLVSRWGAGKHVTIKYICI